MSGVREFCRFVAGTLLFVGAILAILVGGELIAWVPGAGL